MTKKAAVRANLEIGALPSDLAAAIIAACDEIIAGVHHEQFIVDIMGREAGDYAVPHSNDHVNHGQSTNDVAPSALEYNGRCVCRAGMAFADVLKIGRTCMQAAQPMALGQEFGGYACAIRRQAAKIAGAAGDLLILLLGGSAIGPGRSGCGLCASDGRAILARVVDPFDAMQNSDTFARVSSAIRIVAETIEKIAHDLIRQTGLGEIRLPAVQPGSSIMPDKINPVPPMMMQQLAFALVGNGQSVALALMAGQLEIDHFEPVIAARLFESTRLLTNGNSLFADIRIRGIEVVPGRALDLLLNSPGAGDRYGARTGLHPGFGDRETGSQGRGFLCRGHGHEGVDGPRTGGGPSATGRRSGALMRSVAGSAEKTLCSGRRSPQPSCQHG
ncbi:MAG: lyase family protein [Paenirhodobacter sp.]